MQRLQLLALSDLLVLGVRHPLQASYQMPPPFYPADLNDFFTSEPNLTDESDEQILDRFVRFDTPEGSA